MNTLTQYAVGLAIAALVAIGLVSWGKHLTQVEWDKEKAVQAALLKAEEDRGKQVAKDMEARHGKELEFAKSEAGRAAVRRWVREHGLLPSTTQTPSGGASLPNDPSGEQVTGGGIEDFAGKCARDANRLTDFQEICRAQGCEIR